MGLSIDSYRIDQIGFEGQDFLSGRDGLVIPQRLEASSFPSNSQMERNRPRLTTLFSCSGYAQPPLWTVEY